MIEHVAGVIKLKLDSTPEKKHPIFTLLEDAKSHFHSIGFKGLRCSLQLVLMCLMITFLFENVSSCSLSEIQIEKFYLSSGELPFA